jgi:hypothetical protein
MLKLIKLATGSSGYGERADGRFLGKILYARGPIFREVIDLGELPLPLLSGKKREESNELCFYQWIFALSARFFCRHTDTIRS